MNSNERGAPIQAFAGGREMPVFGAVADNRLVIMGGIGDVGKMDSVLTFLINEEDWSKSGGNDAEDESTRAVAVPNANGKKLAFDARTGQTFFDG